MLFHDLHTPYQEYLDTHGENSLNIRHIDLEKVPERFHKLVKSNVRFQKAWTNSPERYRVRINNTKLDPILGHLEGWYGDRHPNSEGYNLIARENIRFLKSLISSTENK